MRSADGTGLIPAPMLLVTIAAQSAEVVGLFVVIAFNVLDAATGNKGTTSNAAAFIVVEAIVAIGVAWITTGLIRFRPWSRTPAVMTQLLTAVIALWLLEAHRYGWGIPPLVLAIAGLAGLFTPSSLRALNRPASPGGTTPR